MTKREYVFNLKLCLSLFLSSCLFIYGFGAGIVEEFIVVEISLFASMVFTLLRAIAPFAFTLTYPHLTPQMQEGGFYVQVGTFGVGVGWDSNNGPTVSAITSVVAGVSADAWVSYSWGGGY